MTSTCTRGWCRVGLAALGFAALSWSHTGAEHNSSIRTNCSREMWIIVAGLRGCCSRNEIMLGHAGLKLWCVRFSLAWEGRDEFFPCPCPQVWMWFGAALSSLQDLGIITRMAAGCNDKLSFLYILSCAPLCREWVQAWGFLQALGGYFTILCQRFFSP